MLSDDGRNLLLDEENTDADLMKMVMQRFILAMGNSDELGPLLEREVESTKTNPLQGVYLSL